MTVVSGNPERQVTRRDWQIAASKCVGSFAPYVEHWKSFVDRSESGRQLGAAASTKQLQGAELSTALLT